MNHDDRISFLEAEQPVRDVCSIDKKNGQRQVARYSVLCGACLVVGFMSGRMFSPPGTTTAESDRIESISEFGLSPRAKPKPPFRLPKFPVPKFMGGMTRGRAKLNFAKSTYSEDTATAFAALAKLAYCGPTSGTFAAVATTCPQYTWPLGASTACGRAQFGILPRSVRYFTEGTLVDPELFGYTARVVTTGSKSTMSNGVIISFRGSTNGRVGSKHEKQTYIEKGSLAGCKTCGVHKGYYKSYQQLEPQLMMAIDQEVCLPGKCTIYVTGHGSGAALATYAAAALAKKKYTIGHSYLFSTPKVGDENLAHYLEGKFSGPSSILFSVIGHDISTGWPYEPEFKPWGIKAFYKENATTPFICSVDEKNCGIQDAKQDPVAKGRCYNPLAPEKTFCKFHAWMPTCYGGMPFHTVQDLPEFAKGPEQPSAQAAASWHPAEEDGTRSISQGLR